MKKPIDPNETYVVRKFLACGEGHFLNHGYTHWESGEACPHGHEPNQPTEYYHLYGRDLLQPTTTMDGTDMDEFLHRPENAGKWGQFPVASGGTL